MKKLLMSLAVIGACAAMSAKADGSYLYWMVDQSAYTFDTAYLWAVDSDDGTKVAFRDASVAIDGTSTSPDRRFPIDVTDAANYSYLVELYADNHWVAQSASPLTWETVQTGLYQPTQTIKPVAFTSFTNVPEPTSGMMLLLGMGLLALKRKKA